MTTPIGQISFSNIISEFGTPPNKNIGAYRVNQSVSGRNWTLDNGIPSSGQISFSQFRNKTLNVVVDYSGITEYNVNSVNVYNSSGVVIGGLRSRPAPTSSETKKVYHIIRKSIGGIKTPSYKAALETGSWNSAVLSYIIDSAGFVSGVGGNGGQGSGQNVGETPGAPGGIAFGASYPCSITIESGGVLQGGAGGGGGGGYGYSDPDGNPQDPVTGGGGGGGGYGLPFGTPGGGGPGAGAGNYGSAGTAGTLTVSGNGGNGGVGGGRGTSFGGGGGGGGYDGLGGSAVYAQVGGNGDANGGGKGGSGATTRGGIAIGPGQLGGANGKAIVYNSGVVVNESISSGGIYRGGKSEGTF